MFTKRFAAGRPEEHGINWKNQEIVILSTGIILARRIILSDLQVLRVAEGDGGLHAIHVKIQNAF